MSDEKIPESERGDLEPEAGVPADLIDLYIVLEEQAVERGVPVAKLVEELRTFAEKTD